MNAPPISRLIRQLIGVTISLIIAFLLGHFAQNWWAGFCWLFGHGLFFLALPFYKKRSFFPIPDWIQAIFVALLPLVYLFFLQISITADKSWRGFLHLSDISSQGFAHILALWAPAMGCWLVGTTFLKSLQDIQPNRQKRLLLLVIATTVCSLSAFIPGIDVNFLPLFLITGVILLSQDIYLENARSSMTWLLLWLLFIAMATSIFAFKQSIRIDQLAHQKIAQSIQILDQPDTTQAYHLPFQWDTLSVQTAQGRISPDLLSLPNGEGQFVLHDGRSDWVYHRSDNQGFIQVGRTLGGVRTPLSLASLLFLVGLLYYLIMRATNWLLGYPVKQLLLPLYGPSSLRIRIQLSFFGLALVAFLLVGLFTFSLLQNQKEFLYSWLEQLLSLYAFLLLIAGTLGILLANSITEPIVQIGQKLGNTRLKDNQPLSWPKDDEIGRLVRNYNQMIVDLDESVERLAVHERENAWREMAKQVAHEIKNPLTPMKLQLQQLLRLEKSDPEKAREWSLRTTKNLIDPIDGMALMATAFSEFGRLPEAQATTFDLRDLTQAAHDLHLSNPQDAIFSLKMPDNSCIVHADRNQLLRVCNNLIRNALQALNPDKQGKIDIVLSNIDQGYKLEFYDNGLGVSADIQSKLFQPNFTTKSSGMGLGLAMCKNIINQGGGKIYFETKIGEGSCFYLELPTSLN